MICIPDHYSPAADLLRERNILITGASAGIGAAAAKSFAAHGATVILLGRNKRRLGTVYDEIQESGGPQPVIVPLNLETASAPEFANLAQQIGAELGHLDGILHNAAMLGQLSPIEHCNPAQWEKVIRTNLHAPFLLTQACLPLLKQSPDASIVFMSDAVGRKGRAYWGAYGVSKFGLEGLMQILADELESRNIRVNSLDPGPVLTALRKNAYPAEDSAGLKSPEAVMNECLYLIGPDSRGITGQSVTHSDQ
ncbi:MAG: YciK family oxidoreductase [Pseudomonadota bacterium]